MKQVNILMMGGKRCGKTTVLASMCAEINKALAGTSMSLLNRGRTNRKYHRSRKRCC